MFYSMSADQGTYYGANKNQDHNSVSEVVWYLILAIVSLCILSKSIFVNPNAYLISIVNFIMGTVIYRLFNGNGTFYFLRMLSVPFFAYGLMSSTWALFTNGGNVPAVKFFFSLFYVAGMCMYLFVPLFGHYKKRYAMIASVVVGGLAWVPALFTLGTGPDKVQILTKVGAFFGYAMIGIWIASVALAVWKFFAWLKDLKNKQMSWRIYVANILVILVGFAPIILFSLLAEGVKKPQTALVVSIIMLLVYFALAGAASMYVRKYVHNVAGSIDGLKLPLVITGMYMFVYSSPVINVAPKYMIKTLGVLQKLPFRQTYQAAAEGVTVIFGGLFSKVAEMIIELLGELFKGSISPVALPHVIYLLAFASISILAGVGARRMGIAVRNMKKNLHKKK